MALSQFHEDRQYLQSPASNTTTKKNQSLSSPAFKREKKRSSDPQFGIVITHKSSVSGKNNKMYNPDNGPEGLVPYNFPARAVKRLKAAKGLDQKVKKSRSPPKAFLEIKPEVGNASFSQVDDLNLDFIQELQNQSITAKMDRLTRRISARSGQSVDKKKLLLKMIGKQDLQLLNTIRQNTNSQVIHQGDKSRVASSRNNFFLTQNKQQDVQKDNTQRAQIGEKIKKQNSSECCGRSQWIEQVVSFQKQKLASPSVTDQQQGQSSNITSTINKDLVGSGDSSLTEKILIQKIQMKIEKKCNEYLNEMPKLEKQSGRVETISDTEIQRIGELINHEKLMDAIAWQHNVFPQVMSQPVLSKRQFIKNQKIIDKKWNLIEMQLLQLPDQISGVNDQMLPKLVKNQNKKSISSTQRNQQKLKKRQSLNKIQGKQNGDDQNDQILRKIKNQADSQNHRINVFKASRSVTKLWGNYNESQKINQSKALNKRQILQIKTKYLTQSKTKEN